MAQAVVENNPVDYYSEDDVEPEEYRRPESKILNNVTLEDLQSGGSVIDLDEEYNDDFFEMDDTFKREVKEIPHVASYRLRQERIPPRPEQSFASLESEMEPINDLRLVMKKIVTPGVGGDMPEIAKVVVDYVFYKEHDPTPFDSTYLRNQKKRFIVKQNLNFAEDETIDVIPGLYMAVKTMKKRETSQFLIKWQFGFGEKGIPPRIDPKMDILAIVTLIDFSEIVGDLDTNALTEEEVHKTDFDSVIKKVKGFREEGNKLFKSKNYTKAASFYKKGVNELISLHLANAEEEKTMLELKHKTLLNLAVCYNNIKRPEAACLACQEILAYQPKNVKALFHLAKGKLLLGNYRDCRRFLNEARALEPKNSEINDLLKTCNDKEERHKAGEREFCKKIFPQTSPKRKVEENPKKNDGSDFTGFEKTLREALEDHFENSADDFMCPDRLTAEEIEICLKVAENLKLKFEEGEGGSSFKLKSSNN